MSIEGEQVGNSDSISLQRDPSLSVVHGVGGITSELLHTPGVFEYLNFPPDALSSSLIPLHQLPEETIFREYIGRPVWYKNPNGYTYYSGATARTIHAHLPLLSLQDIQNIWSTALRRNNDNMYAAGYSMIQNSTPGFFNLGNGMIYGKGNRIFIWIDDGSIAVLSKYSGPVIISPDESVGILAPIVLKRSNTSL